MNFVLSVMTTIFIALIVWLGLLVQPAKAPSNFEKYSSATMDYQTMSEAGYSMVAFGREATAEYFDLDGYKASPGATAQSDPAPAPAKAANTQVAAANQAKAEPKPAKPAAETIGSQITGISKAINLTEINKLWQEFSQQSNLSNQLNDYNFTVYAVYTDFNSDYSKAKVTIGYNNKNMKGNKFPLPQGRRVPLLSPGQHQPMAIISSWDKIDYQRPVKAVLERHDYQGEKDTVSTFVIYQ